MRIPQFRIRTLMIGIAFLALVMTVIFQAVLLQRSRLREELLRAAAERHRAVAEQSRVLAEAQARKAQIAFDQLSAELDSSGEKRKP